jgi:hypothetical protein
MNNNAKRSYFARQASIRNHMGLGNNNNNHSGGNIDKSRLLFDFLPKNVKQELSGGNLSPKEHHKTTQIKKRTHIPKLIWKKPEDKTIDNHDYWVNDISTENNQQHAINMMNENGKKNRERKHFTNLIKKDSPKLTFGEKKELVQQSLTENHLPHNQKLIKITDSTIDGEKYIKSLKQKSSKTTKSTKTTKSRKPTKTTKSRKPSKTTKTKQKTIKSKKTKSRKNN